MDKLWKFVVGLTGLAGVGAFVFWSLNQTWLQLGIFDRLTSERTFQVMVLFLVLVFLVLLAILFTHWKSLRLYPHASNESPVDAPGPIAAYLREFPEFLRKPDVDAQCVRTSRESFFSAVRHILSCLSRDASVTSTDSVSLDRDYVRYWFTEGLGYLELNWEAARRGIRISRILIVTRNEFEKHRALLDEIGNLQAMSGVTPCLVLYDNLPDECKREFVVFDNRFVDEVIYDVRSERVIDNYISWSPEKLSQFREKIGLIRSHIEYSWQVSQTMAGDFSDVRQYARTALERVISEPIFEKA